MSNLSPANAFNLATSKLLSFGKGLNVDCMDPYMILKGPTAAKCKQVRKLNANKLKSFHFKI